MDLIETLRGKVRALPAGAHSAGLFAVLEHVETAFSHYARGSRDGVRSAFTDAVYRSNQAFEGSLKEAYRILAGKDPAHRKIYDIETYFEKNSIFRPRVLTQFSWYRREWRNPSTHDYVLNFDGNESLLAILSVCVFAIVLIEQIEEKLSRDRVVDMAATAPKAPPPVGETHAADAPGGPTTASRKTDDRRGSLLDSVAACVLDFCNAIGLDPRFGAIETEAQLLGYLTGFVEEGLRRRGPHLVGATFLPYHGVGDDGKTSFRFLDLVVEDKYGAKVAVEVKRTKSLGLASSDGDAIAALIARRQISGALVVLVPDDARRDYGATRPREEKPIVLIAPLDQITTPRSAAPTSV